MEPFKAQIVEVRDLTEKPENGGRELKAAGFTMRSLGQFPDLDSLIGRTVEIRVVDYPNGPSRA